MSCYLLANNINDIVAARADYNGYVREGAIMRIAELCGISALEYLLRRVNDWGRAVRAAACYAIRQLMHLQYHRAEHRHLHRRGIADFLA